MKKLKSLKIPANNKFPGLVIYCTKCATNIYDKCKQTGEHLCNCPHPDSQRYKYYAHIPGTNNKRITKTFESRNYGEVLPLVKQTKESLKNGGIPNEPPMQPQEEPQAVVPETTSDNLVALMAKYLTFVSGDSSVPSHLRKSRSKQYTSDIEHSFSILLDLLKQQRYDVPSLRASDIDKHLVGKFFEHLQSEKHYSPRTINKNISFMRSFYHWVKLHEGLQINNPFELVVKLPEYHNPLAITRDEFSALIKATTRENGIMRDGGVKGQRNMYRSWLKDAFRLSLFTGRRREEIINFKWSDIIADESGNPVLLQSEDRKVNHIQHREGQHKKINYVPVTVELWQLLMELGYEKFKGSDRYILASEVKMQRSKSMADAISRGFAHFFKQTNPTRELKFKSVRKAYLTSMQIHTGDAKMISGHSGNAVLQEHYIDKAMLAKSLRNFSVFGNPEQSRFSEITRVRKNGKQPEIELER